MKVFTYIRCQLYADQVLAMTVVDDIRIRFEWHKRQLSDPPSPVPSPLNVPGLYSPDHWPDSMVAVLDFVVPLLMAAPNPFRNPLPAPPFSIYFVCTDRTSAADQRTV